MTIDREHERVSLLPCPFCGGKAVVEWMGSRPMLSVVCKGCGNRSFAVVASHGGTEAEAIAAWNTRASSGEVREAGEDGELDAGINYAIERLCEILGVDPKSISWDAAAETMNGDVMSVICNVLVAAYGEEWTAHADTTAAIRTLLATPPIEPQGAQGVEVEVLWAVWSKTGSHIGLWDDEGIARSMATGGDRVEPLVRFSDYQAAEARATAAAELLEIALDEHETEVGVSLDQTEQHWSVAVRAFLSNTNAATALVVTEEMANRALARSRDKDINTLTNTEAMRQIILAALINGDQNGK